MLTRVLSGFSCPKNPDVERFLKNSAVEFTKKSQSVTYLVFSVEGKELVGAPVCLLESCYTVERAPGGDGAGGKR